MWVTQLTARGVADSDVGDNSPLEVWLTVMWVTQLTARGVADSDVGDTTHH